MPTLSFSTSFSTFLRAAAVALLILATGVPVFADTAERKASEFASGNGNLIYLGLGVGLPLLSDGTDGTRHALRAADAIGTSVILADGFKSLTHEERPDHSGHDSFPSGHATAAFAAATVESDLHPHEAPYWYLGATLISASRVSLHRHYIHDVLAGALLGYGTARLELATRRGLVLSPLIQPNLGHGQSGSVGLQAQMTF